MKIKNMMFAALAATMTFAACSNDDAPVLKDQMPKSVTVNLPNLKAAATKSMGEGMKAEQVELTDFKVFFLDAAGNEVTVPQYNSADQDVYFDGTQTMPKIITYHFLPATTVKVVVAGNIVGLENMAYADLPTSLDVLNDATDGKHPSYPLYGESGLTPAADHQADGNTHETVYSASVNLAPRMARFEVFGFEYTDAAITAKFDEVTLKQIALNNYYTKYNYVTKEASDFVGTTLEASMIWGWFDKDKGEWADAIDLTLAPTKKKYIGGAEITDDTDGTKAPDGTKFVTYGLPQLAAMTTPSIDAKTTPELAIALEATKDGVTTPYYMIGKFTNKTFEAGKIYRVMFSFSDTNFTLPERCVELTVTVAEWEVVAVIPEF